MTFKKWIVEVPMKNGSYEHFSRRYVFKLLARLAWFRCRKHMKNPEVDYSGQRDIRFVRDEEVLYTINIFATIVRVLIVLIGGSCQLVGAFLVWVVEKMYAIGDKSLPSAYTVEHISSKQEEK